jgi:hypothetical protein
VLETDRNTVGHLDTWQEDDLSLLLEEGRRHLGRLDAAVDNVRGRAQHALTVGLAMLAVLASQLPKMRAYDAAGHHAPPALLLIFTAAAAALMWAQLGLVSILAVNFEVGAIHATAVSRLAPPRLRVLGQHYAEQVVVMGNRVSTLLTVLREATLWLTIGGALLGVVWVVVTFR